MRNKNKCHTFAFDEKTDELIKKLAKELDMKKVTVIERALEIFADKKGVSK